MDFEERVWKLMERIPKGRVTTYSRIAKKLDSKAYRAVGNACRRNPYAPSSMPQSSKVRRDFWRLWRKDLRQDCGGEDPNAEKGKRGSQERKDCRFREGSLQILEIEAALRTNAIGNLLTHQIRFAYEQACACTRELLSMMVQIPMVEPARTTLLVALFARLSSAFCDRKGSSWQCQFSR